MVLSKHGHWNGSFPSPGDLLKPGVELGTPALQAEALRSKPPGKAGLVVTDEERPGGGCRETRAGISTSGPPSARVPRNLPGTQVLRPHPGPDGSESLGMSLYR